MKSNMLFKLVIFGAVSGLVAWLVRLLPSLLGRLDSIPAVELGRWVVFLAIPAVVGAISALCFPSWQRAVRIGSPLVRSVLFWIVAAIVILTGYSLVMFGPIVTFSGWLSLGGLRWIVSAAAAGLCFYLIDLVTGANLRAQARL